MEKDAETLALERELEDLARQILEVGDLKFFYGEKLICQLDLF